MKLGDLVKIRRESIGDAKVGIVVDFTQRKVWRTNEKGTAVAWNTITPEPHAVVLFSGNNGAISVPTVDLKVDNE